MPRSLRFIMLVCLVFVGVAAQPSAVDAHRSGCFPAIGGFQASPADPSECASPVGFCTQGELTGTLRGTYFFTMDTAMPTGSIIEGINFFTGVSDISTRRGATLRGIDTGTIDLDPTRFGNLASLITFTEGTGYLSHASGQIQVQGSLDFASGETSGFYRGKLCFE